MSTRQQSSQGVVPPAAAPSQAALKEARDILYASKKHLVSAEADFRRDIANALYDAWIHNKSENHLYPLYDIINTRACQIIKCGDGTVLPSPQAVFSEAQGADPADDIDEDDDAHEIGEAAERGQSDLPVIEEQDEEAVAGDEDEETHNEQGEYRDGDQDQEGDVQAQDYEEVGEHEPQQTPTDLGSSNHSKRIPDFARVLSIPSLGDLSRRLVDFWEVKSLRALESLEHWRAQAKYFSRVRILTVVSMEQVYDTALCAFSSDPSLDEVFALLIAGPYFSQFSWTRKQIERTARAPTTPLPSNTRRIAYEEAIRRWDAKVERIKARAIPNVIFYAEPVFTYLSPGQAGANAAYQTVNLSPAFRYAVNLPTTRPGLAYAKIETQLSWFHPSSTKPYPQGFGKRKIVGLEDVTIALHTKPIEKCEGLIRGLTSKRDQQAAAGLGVHPDGPQASPSSTATPSEPSLFRPTRATRSAAPNANNSPLAGRTRARRAAAPLGQLPGFGAPNPAA